MRKLKKNDTFAIICIVIVILLAVFFVPKLDLNKSSTPTPIYHQNNKNLETFKLGIDVSEHQGIIDWKAVSQGSVDFAIIRASYAWNDEGDTHQDKLFLDNVSQAQKHGIKIGAYHYSYATTVEEAKKEAELFLSQIKGIQFEYPVFYDLEDECQDELSKDQMTDIALAFLTEVEKAGYYVGIYSNPSNIQNLDMERLKDYDLWIANYDLQNIYDGDYGIWQYTCYGKVHGIQGDVDLNYCYYDYPSFIKKLGKSNN